MITQFVSRPNFKQEIKFSDTLTGHLMEKLEVTLNKPLYISQTVLNLPKLEM